MSSPKGCGERSCRRRTGPGGRDGGPEADLNARHASGGITVNSTVYPQRNLDDQTGFIAIAAHQKTLVNLIRSSRREAGVQYAATDSSRRSVMNM